MQHGSLSGGSFNDLMDLSKDRFCWESRQLSERYEAATFFWRGFRGTPFTPASTWVLPRAHLRWALSRSSPEGLGRIFSSSLKVLTPGCFHLLKEKMIVRYLSLPPSEFVSPLIWLLSSSFGEADGLIQEYMCMNVEIQGRCAFLCDSRGSVPVCWLCKSW